MMTREFIVFKYIKIKSYIYIIYYIIYLYILYIFAEDDSKNRSKRTSFVIIRLYLYFDIYGITIFCVYQK